MHPLMVAQVGQTLSKVAGFGVKPATTAPTFSFGGAAAKPLGGIAPAPNDKPLGGSIAAKPLGGVVSNSPLLKAAGQDSDKSGGFSFSSNGSCKTTDPDTDKTNNASGDSKTKYYAKLRSLNESVAKWIREHVEKNAFCILTPVFKDYEKHLAVIEKLNPDKKEDSLKADSSKVCESASQKNEKDDSNPPAFKPAEASGFSFGATSTPSTKTSSPPKFSFGNTTGAGSAFGGTSSGFSFKPSTDSANKPALATSGFSFGAPPKPSTANSSAAAEDEEYVPPKAEVAEVKEDDAIYTKRCKLFYQKDGAWVERGVGNIHLKPCNGKTQLVMRADTSLGNIILNIMLHSSIPFKRQGKNNVSLMCIPNPPIDPKNDDKKPVSMLIRVKTGEDADELLEILDKHKSD